MLCEFSKLIVIVIRGNMSLPEYKRVANNQKIQSQSVFEMRILKVLLILAFIQLTLGAANQRNVGKKYSFSSYVVIRFGSIFQYAKVTKIEYNVTGTRCQNPYCRVKPVSRYDSVVDAGCDHFQRPVYGGFVSFVQKKY